MKKRARGTTSSSSPSASPTFRQQVKQSIRELQSIMDRRQSPSGDGRFTVRTMAVIEPSVHGAGSVRAIRKSLNLSQAVFAQLLGVSPALVRAWEIGSRVPAPIARRLLDQVRQHPSSFAGLVHRPAATPPRAAPGSRSTSRPKRVA